MTLTIDRSRSERTIHARVYGWPRTGRCRYCNTSLDGATIHANPASRWGIEVALHCAQCHKLVLSTIYSLPPRVARATIRPPEDDGPAAA